MAIHFMQADEHTSLLDNIPQELQILPLRNTLMYPFVVMPLGVGMPRSVKLIEETRDARNCSVGVAVVVAIASVLSGHPACHEVGMTGEITLRGRVLPVGGVKMKVLAAHRAGLRSVIIPKQNEGDLDELPEEIREALTFIPVDLIGEALHAALRVKVAT